jgi:phosphatidylserine/phosphatidylglycerophosphate/cardiolipin synthase-like enzyme
MRRVDQVMYELIDGAGSHVLLVTYAAYGADKVANALKRASDRGVKVEMVVEVAESSGGSLSFDSVAALRNAVPRASIMWWPREKRAVAESGRPGSMHAKCLVVDRTIALVSSANLTDYALERNMELGLVVRGGDVPARLAAHFQQLSIRGELVPVTIASRTS